METRNIWLQLFGGEGAGAGAGDGAAASGEGNTPDAGESKLLELGVPAEKLKKHRASRERMAARKAAAQPEQAAAAQEEETPPQPTEEAPDEGEEPKEETPKRMTWEEIMQDPEYNRQMQRTIQARLKSANGAESTLEALRPALDLLAKRHGMDMEHLDAAALAEAVQNDDAYYEEKALEMGVDVDVAKRLERSERETALRQQQEARTLEQQRLQAHLEGLQQQGEEMKKVFPDFDLSRELENPAFLRMTSPGVGLSVEDAYYAVHRKEIQTAAMQQTARQTAEQMANAIRSGQRRPTEHGTSAQAPSVTTFDYAHASKEQREALKQRIRDAAAHGKKLYPGQ